jgi:hypothetical protein
MVLFLQLSVFQAVRGVPFYQTVIFAWLMLIGLITLLVWDTRASLLIVILAEVIQQVVNLAYRSVQEMFWPH